MLARSTSETHRGGRDERNGDLPGRACDGGDCRGGVDSTPAVGKGVAWLAGGFLFCPCHLPITLWVIGSAVAGTALEAAVRHDAMLIGIAVTVIWLLSTIRGFMLLNRGGSP